MKKIAISQRVEVIEAYAERRDCLDQRWAALLSQAGYLPVPLFNQASLVNNYIQELHLNGIILSGGNDIINQVDPKNVAPERDAFEHQLIDAAIANNIPILGVCRGFQLLNIHFGGKISKISAHVALRHNILKYHQDPQQQEVIQEVNSFHGFGIQYPDLSPQLNVLYVDEQGWVEAAIEQEAGLAGIMWHPEREKPFDNNDIRFLQQIFN